MPQSKKRLTITEYYTQMLSLVAARSTCPRRQVGAIITDSENRILATGYNGVPRGVDHCVDRPCPGASDTPGNSERCLAVHAEINAILQCSRLDRSSVLYVSCTPCFTCAKAICNTPIKKIVVLESYADPRGLDLFAQLGIEVCLFAPV